LNSRRFLGAVGPLLLAALLFAGCGMDFRDLASEEEPEFTRALAHCKTLPLDGSYDRVKLHNAGISCSEAVEMTFILVRSDPHQTTYSKSGQPWSCRALPQARFPLTWRCDRNQRYFTVEHIRLR
jgi:hypothetical protein